VSSVVALEAKEDSSISMDVSVEKTRGYSLLVEGYFGDLTLTLKDDEFFRSKASFSLYRLISVNQSNTC